MTGCATRSVPPEPSTDNWRLQGKLSIQSTETTRVLNIDWRQRDEVGQIQLSGPLGMSVATIEASGDDLVITTGEGVTRYKDDLKVSAGEGLDIQLPWRTLSRWVRGETETGALIPPGGLEVDSWTVEVVDRTDLGPRIIEFRHRLMSIKLVVKKWLFEAV